MTLGLGGGEPVFHRVDIGILVIARHADEPSREEQKNHGNEPREQVCIREHIVHVEED